MPRLDRQAFRRFRALFMPYDVYERHAVVVRLLLKVGLDQKDATVLDVGGCSALLRRFMACRVLSINLDARGDLVGSGAALPFADGSFAAVVSIDTLEHLLSKSRLPFLQECLRVARHYAIIAAPLGSEGHSQSEKRLDDLYRSVFGKPHAFLDEHVRYGLPDAVELERLIGALGTVDTGCYFAGDYVWQGRQFERAIQRARNSWGIFGRLAGFYDRIAAWALFHPIQLGDRPHATTNRFYLLIAK